VSIATGIVVVLALFHDGSLKSANLLLPIGPFFAPFPGMARQMFVVHFETGSGTLTMIAPFVGALLNRGVYSLAVRGIAHLRRAIASRRTPS
jgi:uncharacterized ion transporter superfamily protein YfcC